MHFFKSRSKKLQHTCSKWGRGVKGRLNNVKKTALLVFEGFPYDKQVWPCWQGLRHVWRASALNLRTSIQSAFNCILLWQIIVLWFEEKNMELSSSLNEQAPWICLSDKSRQREQLHVGAKEKFLVVKKKSLLHSLYSFSSGTLFPNRFSSRNGREIISS